MYVITIVTIVNNKDSEFVSSLALINIITTGFYNKTKCVL